MLHPSDVFNIHWCKVYIALTQIRIQSWVVAWYLAICQWSLLCFQSVDWEFKSEQNFPKIIVKLWCLSDSLLYFWCLFKGHHPQYRVVNLGELWPSSPVFQAAILGFQVLDCGNSFISQKATSTPISSESALCLTCVALTIQLDYKNKRKDWARQHKYLTFSFVQQNVTCSVLRFNSQFVQQNV